MDTPKPVGKPIYDALGDAGTILSVIQEYGGEAFERALKDEVRESMDEYGVRVVLWYAERLADVNAVFGEFTVEEDPGE